MSYAQKIIGYLTGYGAEVDVNNQLKITSNSDSTKAGAANMFTESDPGVVIGTRLNLSPETSQDYRLRVGFDSILDFDNFNYTLQNTNKHYYAFNTLTMDLNGGMLRTNAGAVNTTTVNAVYRTRQHFAIYQSNPLYCETWMALTTLIGVNTFIEWGMYIPGAAPFDANDGVSFRWEPAGLRGVITVNGSEVLATLFNFTPTLNKQYKYTIAISKNQCQFWINDVLYGVLPTPDAYASPSLACSMPFTIRHAHVGGAAGNTTQAKFASYQISLGDLDTGKTAGDIMGLMNGSLSCNQGGVSLTPANFPASGATTNTWVPANDGSTACVGLGGRVRFALATTGPNDLIFFTYLNPAGLSTLSGRNIMIQGIKLSSAVITTLVAPAQGVPVISIDLRYGGTQLTLATAESASFVTATAKFGRRIALGYMNWSGVSTTPTPGPGLQSNDIYVPFATPIVVWPGEYVQLSLRSVNANAGGLVELSYALDGYWK